MTDYSYLEVMIEVLAIIAVVGAAVSLLVLLEGISIVRKYRSIDIILRGYTARARVFDVVEGMKTSETQMLSNVVKIMHEESMDKKKEMIVTLEKDIRNIRRDIDGG